MLHEEDARRLALAVLWQAYQDFQHIYGGIRQQMRACVCNVSPRVLSYRGLSGHSTIPLLERNERELLEFWLNKNDILSVYLELAGLAHSPVPSTKLKICQDYRDKCLPCLVNHRRKKRASK